MVKLAEAIGMGIAIAIITVITTGMGYVVVHFIIKFW